MPTDSEATTVGIDSGARLPRTRPFCPHVYLVIRSGVGSGESVYGCASAAALVFLPGAARARVVPPDLGNIGPSSEQDRQLGIVEPIGAKTKWDDVAKCLQNMVARDGVERPTAAFSGLYSLSLNPFSFNNLIRQDGRFIVTIL